MILDSFVLEDEQTQLQQEIDQEYVYVGKTCLGKSLVVVLHSIDNDWDIHVQ